ncbi:MAG TPA: 5-bromo-4-chloroindolyl phosphate hydrolysis family protein [Anaerovoracaceae bacterium]|nr:5-bromo-4-chloroindolyl phosphate hydrolysis family protein [Anaerovoracaceae bacterium]
MRNDNYIDFGEEIGRTVRRVLNGQDFSDLKNTINHAMRNVPGMGGGPFHAGPYDDGSFPRLSKDDVNGGGSNGAYGAQGAYARGAQTGRPHYRKHKGASFVPSTLFLTFGSIGAVGFGVPSLVGFILENSMANIPAMEVISRVFGVLFAISLVLFFHGICLRKRTKRFRLYQKVLNGRTYCTVKELAAASGRDTKFIVKDLRKMIRSGLFAEGYLDDQETCLMADYQTYTQYTETMKYAKEREEAEKREKEKWATREGGAELKAAIDEGKNYIRTIKEANDALPEAEISEKLDQLEQVTVKIFDYVEQHPEKLPEIRKFMSYYMPITLKLVTAYQRFDRHGSNTAEAEDAKLEIKGTLDTINKAYRNLLKKLMQADILDVSSDISALETILAQEGLTGDDFKTGSAKLS